MDMSADIRWPAYLELAASGALASRAERALDRLEACDLCPRRCGADRLDAKSRPVCGVNRQAVVGWWGPMAEEACLSGPVGAGGIVFSGCSMRCIYCSSAEISLEGKGDAVSDEGLAEIMLALQAKGCATIDLVGPSHVASQILAAVAIAARRGLRLPLVWNSGGYDAVEALKLMEGVVDVYLPDVKYSDAHPGRAYSRVADYVDASRAAVKEMHRQVGDLVVDGDGMARRGLLVRHLVLPGGLAGSQDTFAWLAEEISPATAIHVMGEYDPCFRAQQYPPLDRPPALEDLDAARAAAEKAGLRLVG